MMNRREFVRAAAGTAMFTQITGTFPSAASYDLIVRGGRVIDPSLRIDAVCDVAITGGRIAAVEPDIKAAATNAIDARGKIVVPGLIDIHTHAARVKDGPAICLADGVLINIGRAGILPDGDTMDLSRADVGAARAAIERHRDIIVGVKARLSREVSGNDYEVLRRAQEIVSSFNLPVMIHMGQTMSPLARLF